MKSATITAKTGLPEAKFTVPSIGSMIHTGASPLRAPIAPGSAATASSPTAIDPGASPVKAAVKARSAARSATVTRSPGFFSLMSPCSSFAKYGMISAAAISAMRRPTVSASGSIVSVQRRAVLEAPGIGGREANGEVCALLVVVAVQHLAMAVEPGDRGAIAQRHLELNGVAVG